MNQILITLEKSPRGHACLSKTTGNMIIYLETLTRLLNTPREYFPFNTIEELLSELTIHELLHEITEVKEDYVIDSWHMLTCRLIGDRACDCPIDCFVRDVLAVNADCPKVNTHG